MRTIEKTVFKFSELSNSAKETAANWFLQDPMFDPDYILEDAETIAGFLGITINQSTVKLMGGGTRQTPMIHYSVGDYRSYVAFSGYFHLNDINFDKLVAHAPQDSTLHEIADRMLKIKNKYTGEISGIITTGWRGTSTAADPELDSEDEDESLTDDDSESIIEAIADFSRWILSSLNAEFEYTQSEEYIAEMMEANNYEFDEDGRVI